MPIWLANLRCEGDESSISDCNHGIIHVGGITNCDHSEDAGISCETEPLGIDDVRLTGTGSSRTQGRVEVQIQGTWGTICDIGFDTREARVLCRMLGLNTTYARSYSDAWFGEGNSTMPIWLTYLRCRGDESSISECDQDAFSAGGDHSQDAGISCETEPLGKAHVRLTGTGSNRTQGRVEVQILGVWGTICDEGFGTREARVLCRMLGLNTAYAWAYGDARFGEGNETMPIRLANLWCEGDESSISDCYHDAISAGGIDYCDHSEDAGISCEPEPLGKAHVRLAGTGSSHTQGRVEVQIMGTWGTVCDYHNNFGISDAMVFCRMLGLNTTSASVYTIQGDSTMPIWLGTMQCEGSEFSISDCYHGTIPATYYCDHSMDAGISCETEEVSTTYMTTGLTSDVTESTEATLDLKRCPNNTDRRGAYWTESSPNQLNFLVCPDPLSGNLTRRCNRHGKWEEANYDDCVHREIRDIVDRLANLTDAMWELELKDELVELDNLTASLPLVHGDLQEIATFLDSILTRGNRTIQENTFDTIIQVASNVIDEQNHDGWETFSAKEKPGASQIMNAVSQFCEIASTSFNFTEDSVIINTTNIVVEFGRGKTKDLEFPDSKKPGFPHWLTSSQNKYKLDKEALGAYKGKDVSFSSIFYRNLSPIVPQPNISGVEEIEDAAVSSIVMSLTLSPKPAKLEPPLQLWFQTITNTNNYSRAHCSYWDFDVSGTPNGAWLTDGCILVNSSSDVTVCECDHLTNYAVLMNHQHAQVPTVHIVPLRIISIVGCGISLLCLLVTMGTHIYLWRYVKSDRTIILMNLCVALIAAYLLFVAGIDRTENKDVCTAIAALLHYTYLVVFFMMLAEGIEMAIIVLYVLPTGSRVKWMILLCWGVPAVMVGISMGVTQLTGYGNEEFCWLSVNDALIFAFVGPALAIILINAVIACAVFRAMLRTTVMLQKSTKQRAKMGLRSLCILLPVMGLTWAFGAFSLNEDLIAFQYLFAICNSLQGLFIFIFHCVMNPHVCTAIAHIRRRKRSSAGLTSQSYIKKSKETDAKTNCENQM